MFIVWYIADHYISDRAYLECTPGNICKRYGHISDLVKAWAFVFFFFFSYFPPKYHSLVPLFKYTETLCFDGHLRVI